MIRHISWLSNDAEYTSRGPRVSNWSDFVFLSAEDWMDVVPPGSPKRSIAECVGDGVIPWIECGDESHIEELDRLECPAIVGPNFLCRERIMSSPWVMGKLEQSDEQIKLSEEVRTKSFRGITQRITHFPRPWLYSMPFDDPPKRWEVLYIHKSGRLNQELLDHFGDDIYLLKDGHYNVHELVYRARRSRVVVYASEWDAGTLVAPEVLFTGCPVVSTDRAFHRFNYIHGKMGISVGYALEDASVDDYVGAIQSASKWDRRMVHEETLMFYDPNRLRVLWRNAIWNIFNHWQKISKTCGRP